MSYYHHYTTAHLVDTSQYSFSTPAQHDDTPTTRSSPPLSSVEQACELEAYAEAAANRIYFWDEIHPAYRDHPTDNYCEPMQSPVDDDEYYEDVTDEELAEMNRRCMEYQKQLAESKVLDVEETRTVEAVAGEDWKVYDDEDKNDEEDVTVDDLLLPPQPSYPKPIHPHHILCDNVVITSSLTILPLNPYLSSLDISDILTPIPHPLAPNIWCMSHPHHQHRSNYNPPDILIPLPLPCKPNIHHRYLS